MPQIKCPDILPREPCNPFLLKFLPPFLYFANVALEVRTVEGGGVDGGGGRILFWREKEKEEQKRVE